MPIWTVALLALLPRRWVEAQGMAGGTSRSGDGAVLKNTFAFADTEGGWYF
jgi:hypothetical protein